MKSSNTSQRLKQIMNEQNLRQIDILNLCSPFCEKFDIKLGKNDLSQYVNGKVEPGQDKLTVLGMALGVSEAWLMGYDIPRDRVFEGSDLLTAKNPPATVSDSEGLTDDEKRILEKFRAASEDKRLAAEYVLGLK